MTSDRVRVDAKFFRLGAQKFQVKGIAYGPFAPNAEGEMFASREQTASDFKLIAQLAANVVRIYYVPSSWFLDLASEHGIKVFIDIPWPKHLCFLDSMRTRKEALETVRRAVSASKGHPAVFAHSVVNEIPADIARWNGVARTERFIDELVGEAKQADPEGLFTFNSFPPTEYLQPQDVDFCCFNVYLHHRASFEAYMARLQTLADHRPLVLGEFGMDSIREGEPAKCEYLKWQIEAAFRCGLAGTVAFSFTDDWYRGGMQIDDWGFGLTTRDRQPKDSFQAVQSQYKAAPYFPLQRAPKVSVVVATYNGARTLKNCLESLTRLNYPDYEVILIDDGSRDRTPEIASGFPTVRYVRQSNQGLSSARNAGIRAATGKVVAFTDDDCRADEDWLYYLVGDLQRGAFVAIGGHNFLPPEDSCVAAAVVVSPGGPAQVMLTDVEAEHIPGCNMAFYRRALEEAGMFDPIFRKAGDDVDMCWRLLDSNRRIGFSHAGFVWHYRRSTVKAYLKQQAGYGEAEALLLQKHPEHFSSFGGGLWRGHIYTPANYGLLLRGAVIYHGVFGSGFFQRLYAPAPVQPLLICTSLGYHVFVNLPLILLSSYFDVLKPVAAASVALSLGVCVLAAWQARLPRRKERFWSRPLVAFLFLLQPIVRGWARFKWRFNRPAGPGQLPAKSLRPGLVLDARHTVVYWSEAGLDRFRFLQSVLSKLNQAGWTFKMDTGWTSHDVEILADLWATLRLTTVTEELERGKTNIRCRIYGAWSLPAKIVLWVCLVVVASFIAIWAGSVPWVWLTLISLPLVCWWIDEECHSHAGSLIGLLDAVAGDYNLVKTEL